MGVKIAEKMLVVVNQEGPDGDELVRRARMTVVDYYMAKGQYAKVLAPLEELVKEDPGNVAWLRTWTAAAIQAGRPRRCLELLAFAIERVPLNWAARDAAREVLELPGIEDYSEALKQALALEGIVKQTENEYPSLRDPQKGPSLRRNMGGLPTLAEIHYRIGYAMEKTDRFKEALPYFKLAIDEDPKAEWGQRSQRGLTRLMSKLQQPAPIAKPVQP
jgi:tetratricopeptide (TPR) repeat protein